jgi:hypothetical protein|nr:MAG TPA: hypothetical protein [Caudoviricetes sp.]
MRCPCVRIGYGTCVVLLPLYRPALQCVHGYSIVDLVVCLCVRAVSLWDGGDGLCWAEGRGVLGVWCLVLVHCLLFSPLPLLFCVGVRGSARAALRARTLSPNTIVSFLLSCSLVFSSLFHSPSFFRALRLSPVAGMAVSVYHVSLYCVGMTAMGSLSLSSSFFW